MAIKPIKSYARTVNPLELPSLIDIQLDSFEVFISEGLAALFDEISPIESFKGNLQLFFPSNRPEVEGFDLNYWFGEPKYSVENVLSVT
jgi:DNA-directed RNA polymerase subunit beta